MELIGFSGTPEQSVEVVWCSCEYCSAMGPRYMVVARHRHEVLLPLRSGCCLANMSALLQHEACTIGIP
jgi:hypothetical protein